MDIFHFEQDPTHSNEYVSDLENCNSHDINFSPIEEIADELNTLTLDSPEHTPSIPIPINYSRSSNTPRRRRSSVQSLSSSHPEYEIPIDEEFIAHEVENNLPVEHKITPKDFERLAVLGKGAYGTVK
ncbi:hypothetical protein DSO57_1020276 [Entomophthora muscae]|uniref:Uncharacterized protein n=1 Tax=Entomophthora muscae TaxID=34485 RepID=A0ACC2S5W1_9FUNG|nr:hypothetical protein DSO57_1020276 [Entomophthora muscae]